MFMFNQRRESKCLIYEFANCSSQLRASVLNVCHFYPDLAQNNPKGEMTLSYSEHLRIAMKAN
jgi:hypothetical protein